jgi:hypothetical protein
MVCLSVAVKGDNEYENVCNFAKEIYKERLGGDLNFFPGVFVYAEDDKRVVGCLGLTSAQERNPLLVEKFFDFDIWEKISNGATEERKSFGEIGCLAIAKEGKKYLSPALTAGLIIVSYYLGYRYLALMTTKIIQRMARLLDIKIINIGDPDWSKDCEFIDEWHRYSKLRPDTIGLEVAQALAGCVKNISQFADINYGGLLPKIL